MEYEESTMKIDDLKRDFLRSSGHRIMKCGNHQYSIWPVAKEIPFGWENVGFQGTHAECLTRVEELWTDMNLVD